MKHSQNLRKVVNIFSNKFSKRLTCLCRYLWQEWLFRLQAFIFLCQTDPWVKYPRNSIFFNFERILYWYEMKAYFSRNLFFLFLYNLIFKPYHLSSSLAPLREEIDICSRGLFCPKFDAEKLLFEAFLGIMRILTAVRYYHRNKWNTNRAIKNGIHLHLCCSSALTALACIAISAPYKPVSQLTSPRHMLGPYFCWFSSVHENHIQSKVGQTRTRYCKLETVCKHEIFTVAWYQLITRHL